MSSEGSLKTAFAMVSGRNRSWGLSAHFHSFVHTWGSLHASGASLKLPPASVLVPSLPS